jgi:hypothetical protein
LIFSYLKTHASQLSKSNVENAKRICRIVKLAFNDLMLAAFTDQPTILDKNISKFIPKEDIEKNMSQHKIPLFSVKNNELHCRGDMRQAIKDRGIIDGIKESFSAAHVGFGMLFCQLFKVKVKSNTSKKEEVVSSESAEKVYHELEKSNARCIIS